MNRPDFCAKLLAQIGEDEAAAALLDNVFVTEQGTQKVVDSEFFALAEKALGDRLGVNTQGNLGGSGGYARGQLESVRKGTATYSLMMDDDVVCEPEGIVRAVTFGDLARRPTIVGGHMFAIYSRSRLHSFGEIVQPWKFWWMTPLDGFSDWDFAARNLRSARWLHKRVDVDFNGWFMCLIPRQVLERDRPVAADLHQVGRQGVRAARQGGRLPDRDLPGRRGLAHPVDRQERRRSTGRPTSTTATVSSRRCCTRRTPMAAGWCARASTIRSSTWSRSSTPPWSCATRRCRTSSPARTDCMACCPQARRGQRVPQAVHRCAAAYRPRHVPARPSYQAAAEGQGTGADIPGRLSQLVTAGLAPIRQLRPVREMSKEHPEAELTAMDAKWYRLATYDSAIVSMNDGASAALYRRDPQHYRELLRKTIAIHAQLHREWPRLAAEYRAALPDITSPEAWEETFRPWTETEE